MRKIKLKYKDTYIDDILPDTTLYEISKKINDFEFPIIGAKVNNLITDLSTTVTENGKVEFLDRSSREGNEIYRRSLEFLCIVAASSVFKPSTEILINYSLDNGIYCEVVGQRLTPKLIDKLQFCMKSMTREKFPFVKTKVSRFEAIKYFKRNAKLDKVKNLNYTSNSVVDLYSLNGVYDYFFGPLVYNTGQITRFKLVFLDSNTFVINYPSCNSPKVINKYKPHEKVYNKYKEYKNFGQIINIDMVADLNDMGALGKYNDAINLFETHYEAELSKVADKIYNHRKNIKLVLLSGPSSSGKTTTTKKLTLYLRSKGLKPYQISLDNYYVDRAKTPKDADGNYDYASIKATDTDMFNRHLTKLLNGERVNMPTYDFVNGRKVFGNNFIKLDSDSILLIEGIHTLNDSLTKNIKRENKMKIFIAPIIQLKIDNHNRIKITDLRKIRRIVRDSKTRGFNAEQTLKVWANVDKEAEENIYPYQDDVDLVINTSLSYEIGVLRTYAEPLLYGIKSNSEVYSEAIRLINLLRQFMPISSEGVPKNSMLREFIGNGIFD